MQRHTDQEPVGKTTVRVFYPNPVKVLHGVVEAEPQLDAISKEYEVAYLWKNDPIYHELVFATPDGKRIQIVGLAYILEEEMAPSAGIDASVA